MGNKKMPIIHFKNAGKLIRTYNPNCSVAATKSHCTTAKSRISKKRDFQSTANFTKREKKVLSKPTASIPSPPSSPPPTPELTTKNESEKTKFWFIISNKFKTIRMITRPTKGGLGLVKKEEEPPTKTKPEIKCKNSEIVLRYNSKKYLD